MRIIIAFIVAIAVTLLVTPVAKKLGLKYGVYDTPDHRKVHRGIITRTGGIAIYLGFLAGVIVYGSYSLSIVGLVVSSTIVVAVGLYDDVKGISPKMKLLGQVVAAAVLMGFGVQLHYLTNPFTGNLINMGVFSIPITLIWIIGVSNAVNLVDGLDGLASGISGIAALSLGVVFITQGHGELGAIAICLVGGVIGFLRYNFHPAQLFMGDCGSLFLGYVLGSLSIMGLSSGATIIALFIPIMILAIPIMDTFFAITRRYKNKKPIFEADRGHLHHQILDMGVNHKYTVLCIYGITFIFGGLGILVTLLDIWVSMVILAISIVAVFIFARSIGIMDGHNIFIGIEENKQ